MAPSTTPLTTHYAIVIDAGSSGSRLQIYSWRDPDLERAEILEDVNFIRGGQSSYGSSSGSGKGRWWWGGQDGHKGKGREMEMEDKALRRLVRVGKGVEGDDWVKRVEPGISSISPTEVHDYLAPLLSHALQHIPPSLHSQTPIYLLATAGMRLLPPSESDDILASTCNLLRKQYPFRLDGASEQGPCGESVRVISGEEEGLWGWVAVNYLMDGFGHAPTASTDESAVETSLLPLAPLADAPPDSSAESVTPVDVSHHSPTFGFLDMGGASTQLAFSPSDEELKNSGFPAEELRNVKLRLLSGEEVEWDVFVASWLGFGTNRARERYVEALLESWNTAHPQPTTSDLSVPIPDPCLPVNLLIPSSSGSTPDLIGTGSFTECLSSLYPLLSHATPCPTDHCLFAGQPTPHIDFAGNGQRGFIGISEYWYTTRHVLGVKGDGQDEGDRVDESAAGLGGVWDWGEWEKGMGAWCEKDWAAIGEEVEQGRLDEMSSDPTRLEMQCFKGAWISNILHSGIGIPRLTDAGGNTTLTGGEIGDTNSEAEHRAREKGLLSSQGHFQSMDQVGETAISWTLGKMVIEASKAVPLRSSSAESWWAQHLPRPLDSIGLPPSVEGKLEDMGLSAVYVYAMVAFGLIWCLFIRRSTRYSVGAGGAGARRRKPSVSGPYTTPARGWLWGWSGSPDSCLTIEDGLPSLSDATGASTGGARFPTPGRLRLWSHRLSNLLRTPLASLSRKRPASSPNIGLGLGNLSARAGPSSVTNTPMSNLSPHSTPPQTFSSFFVPAHSLAVGGAAYPNGLTPGTGSETGTISPMSSTLSSSPSRGGLPSKASSISGSNSGTGSGSASVPGLGLSGRPYRSRQNSYNVSSTAEGARSPPGTGGGWNDPPLSMLPSSSTAGALLDTPLYSLSMAHKPTAGVNGGVLTPTACGALSRNSSRVNLSELGLAQRSMSRAGTPGPGVGRMFDE